MSVLKIHCGVDADADAQVTHEVERASVFLASVLTAQHIAATRIFSPLPFWSPTFLVSSVLITFVVEARRDEPRSMLPQAEIVVVTAVRNVGGAQMVGSGTPPLDLMKPAHAPSSSIEMSRAVERRRMVVNRSSRRSPFSMCTRVAATMNLFFSSGAPSKGVETGTEVEDSPLPSYRRENSLPKNCPMPRWVI